MAETLANDFQGNAVRRHIARGVHILEIVQTDRFEISAPR
jgi:hypothetical protein